MYFSCEGQRDSGINALSHTRMNTHTHGPALAHSRTHTRTHTSANAHAHRAQCILHHPARADGFNRTRVHATTEAPHAAAPRKSSLRVLPSPVSPCHLHCVILLLPPTPALAPRVRDARAGAATAAAALRRCLLARLAGIELVSARPVAPFPALAATPVTARSGGCHTKHARQHALLGMPRLT